MSDTQSLQRWLQREHEEFISVMYPDFSLTQPPTSIEIRLLDCGFPGLGQEGSQHYINIPEPEALHYVREPIDSCHHESAHYLHFLASPEVEKAILTHHAMCKDNFDFRIPLIRLIEFVAELGTMKFNLNRYPNRPSYNYHFVQRVLETGFGFSANLEVLLPAYFVAKTEPSALRMISALSMSEAIGKVDGYIEKYAPHKSVEIYSDLDIPMVEE